MIHTLELTNFKQHENLSLNFAAGLTAVKGANEAGKSTIYHAIAYALFGARSLPMSLAETVTWGKPDSSLKVKLKFIVDNVEYLIARGKSGAELSGTNLLVSGQSEVTKYVETLFNVNADSASKLMIASQGKLRGALESKEAVSLIEKLANISLLDELVTKIQQQLPSGNTKILENRLAEIVIEEVVAPNFREAKAHIELLELEARNAVEVGKACASRLGSLDTEKARQVIVEASQRIKDIDSYNNGLKQLEARRGGPEVLAPVTLENLYELVAAQKAMQKTLKAKTVFDKHVKQAFAWQGPALDGYLLGLLEQKRGLKESLELLKTRETKATYEAINEDSCAFCGKLLQDVPEVVVINEKVQKELSEVRAMLSSDSWVLEELKEEIKTVEAILAYELSVVNLSKQLAEYTALGKEQGIAQLTWTASLEVDGTDYEAISKDLGQQQAAYDAYKIQLASSAMLKVKYSKWLVDNPMVDVAWAQKVLEKAEAFTQQKEAAWQREGAAGSALLAARYDLKTMERAFEYRQQRRADALEAKAVLVSDIAVYDKNNALIKRLRESRPVVAAKLWTVVLSAVSYYFSVIRGTPTTITMDGDSFKADGKPVESLSGSTLDSLGLAIRMALGKTFLPGIDFLLLDEPAAGMDDERESAMLGMLAASGYGQVLVVTHSVLADSFATEIIQL